MSNNNTKQRPEELNQAKELPVSEEVLREILSQQRERIEIDKTNLRLEELRIQSNERLACKSIDYQARDIKSRPGETRKTFIVFAIFVFIFTLLLVALIIYLLHTGKDDYANKLLLTASYLVVILLSYWAGKKSKKGNSAPLSENEYFEVADEDNM